MTTSEYLASLGYTVPQARDFILANYQGNLALIYNTATQYQVTNVMLSEIIGGVTAGQVRDYFDTHGYSSAALDPAPVPDPVIYDSVPQGPGDLVGLGAGAAGLFS
ncbi:MAG: hypothetical protein JWQ07_4920 [Ramlibacter sp.]|nr:hypothetical protein [Ramlibacter sp.]